MIPLLGLAIFSGFSLNLLFQFALGTLGVAGNTTGKAEATRRLPLFQTGILFLSSLLLWVFFYKLIPGFLQGFAEFFLFFPLSALFCMGLEFLGERVLSKTFPSGGGMQKVYSSYTAYEGLVPASLIITFLAANNFTSAFVLALFFAMGNMTAMLIIDEIRRRSTLEWVPHHLRGGPLVLITMGLLSLISVSVAGICFRMLEIF